MAAPHDSSQECSRCGHTHPENRKEDRFFCIVCGFLSARGYHAACTIRRHGIKRLRDGLTKGKAVKRVSFRKNSSRAGRPVCLWSACKTGRRRKMTVARCASKQEVDSCEARSTGFRPVRSHEFAKEAAGPRIWLRQSGLQHSGLLRSV